MLVINCEAILAKQTDLQVANTAAGLVGSWGVRGLS